MAVNYFELLGQPQQFQLDEAALRLAYQLLQRKMHPDNFSQASESERLKAVSQGALLNEAYQHLQDPVKRSLHLLSLAGALESFEQYRVNDKGFLIEQMTWRDDLAEIEQSQNAAELTTFDKTLRQQIQTMTQKVEQCLNQHDWPEAQLATAKLRFMLRLKEEVERLEDRLLDL